MRGDFNTALAPEKICIRIDPHQTPTIQCALRPPNGAARQLKLVEKFKNTQAVRITALKLPTACQDFLRYDCNKPFCSSFLKDRRFFLFSSFSFSLRSLSFSSLALSLFYLFFLISSFSHYV